MIHSLLGYTLSIPLFTSLSAMHTYMMGKWESGVTNRFQPIPAAYPNYKFIREKKRIRGPVLLTISIIGATSSGHSIHHTLFTPCLPSSPGFLFIHRGKTYLRSFTFQTNIVHENKKCIIHTAWLKLSSEELSSKLERSSYSQILQTICNSHWYHVRTPF